MSMRLPLIAGNWKMNKTPAETAELLSALVARLPDTLSDREVVVAPPFPSLGNRSPGVARQPGPSLGPEPSRGDARCVHRRSVRPDAEGGGLSVRSYRAFGTSSVLRRNRRTGRPKNQSRPA